MTGNANRTAEARAALSRERVVDAAIALADASGSFESLTMRRLGDELGTSAMSLYYYVPNKEDLVDAMIDVVFGEIDAAHDRRRLAQRDAAAGALHARGAATATAGPSATWRAAQTPGPASLRLHDAVLGCLREAGFSIEATVYAYSVQDAYIYGFALQERSLPFDDAEGGAAVAEAQYQEYDALEAERQLGELAQAFPYLAEVVVGPRRQGRLRLRRRLRGRPRAHPRRARAAPRRARRQMMFFSGRSAPRSKRLAESGAHVDERLAAQVEVAHDLADRRRLQEAVAREAGRVQEAARAVRLADEGVVVGAVLVQAGPAAAHADLRQPRRAPLDGLGERRAARPPCSPA